MENNNLENEIKESFDAYAPNINNDEIWENIEPHLKKKKKRRFFILWFLVGGILLLTLKLSNPYFFTSEKSKVVLDHVEVSDQELTRDAKVIEPIVEKIETEDIEPSKETIIPAAGNKVLDKKTSITNVLLTTTEKNNPILNKIQPDLIEPQQIEIKQLEEEKILVEPEEIKKVNEIIPEIKKEKKEVNVDEIKEIEKELPIKKVEDKSDQKPKLEDKTEKEKEKKKKIIEPIKNKIRYFVQPGISAIVPFKFLNSKGGSGESGSIRSRKETESQLEAFGISLNFQAQTRKGLVFVSGIEYQRLNERFDRNEVREETETYDATLTITENGEGQLINSTSGPVELTRTTTRKQQFYNKYESINIPIGIGRFIHKPKYDLKLIGGLDFNLHHTFKGVISSANQTTLDLRHNNYDLYFKRQTGFGLWFSTEYHRPVNSRLSWVIAPKLQIPLSSSIKDSYRINQRYYRLSLSIGVNYLMNANK